jgi:apolipoprotein N-acyltransferase
VGKKDKALKPRKQSGPNSNDPNSNGANQTVVSRPLQPNQVTWLAVASSAILLWSSYAPLHLTFTSLLALAPWIACCISPEPFRRSDYFRLWVGGAIFWLLILQGIRLAYWPLYAGWVALSLYLAVYVPLFVGITRVIHHQWRIPLWVAAPLAWTALEMTRAYFLSGFAGSLLAHSFARWPLFLQAVDQISVYGIALWVVLVNTAVAQSWLAWRKRQLRVALPALVSAITVTIALIAYGQFKLNETDQLARTNKPLMRIALIQENAPTMFEATDQSRQDAWQRYALGTKKAVQRFENFDVVVWPESVFTATEPIMLDNAQGELPPELVAAKVSKEQFNNSVKSVGRTFTLKAQSLLRAAQATTGEATQPVYAIVGTDVYDIQPTELKRFNCAALIGPDAQLVDRYAKTHLVMFGEYFPLNGFFGLLYQVFGMGRLSAGDEDKSFEIKGVRLAPSVCFESMVPHRIATQVRTLTSRGESPDILINITNDGWFRGSSILDHHLASATLNAIENRRPFVIAANTGISAWIDGAGQIQAQGGRMVPDQLLAEPYRDGRWGLFQVVGDIPVRVITFIIWLLYILALVKRSGFR